MSDYFAYAVKLTLEDEGVLSDDPFDRGGLTKYGITLPALMTFKAKTGKHYTLAELTRDQAIEIYHVLYWRYDSLVSRMIAAEVFDIGVNRGLTAAVLIMQRAINFHPSPLAVTEDGLWGPSTRDALNILSGSPESRLLLFKSLVYFQARGYVAIVENDPSQLNFFDGWIFRAARRPRD